jgi:hypothetical protein
MSYFCKIVAWRYIFSFMAEYVAHLDVNLKSHPIKVAKKYVFSKGRIRESKFWPDYRPKES